MGSKIRGTHAGGGGTGLQHGRNLRPGGGPGRTKRGSVLEEYMTKCSGEVHEDMICN